MKVKQETITVSDLTNGYVDNNEEGVRGFGGRLDIRPPYQREFIYKDAQRDEVIRTATKEFPLNSMYWAVREDGDFEIIDGQQRTISLCMFVNSDFSVPGLFGVKEPRFFHNLPADKQTAILDYKLTVYQCNGTNDEKLEWFKTINIAGEKLLPQELRNAVYAGKWTMDAKKYFSRTGCPAYTLGGKYMDGAPIRQAYLEKVIRWISDNNIDAYMGTHQHDENAEPLWDYFESVIDWTKKVFPKYRDAMKGIPWGDLHRQFKDHNLDAAALEKRVAELMEDDEVDSDKGVYLYVLTGEERHLNLRQFSKKQKAAAYERQGGKCANPKCKKPFSLKEMEGDHIKPWSKGGKTTDENCQMLCEPCNRRKSDKS